MTGAVISECTLGAIPWPHQVENGTFDSNVSEYFGLLKYVAVSCIFRPTLNQLCKMWHVQEEK